MTTTTRSVRHFSRFEKCLTLLLLGGLGIGVRLAQAEDLTITTYYPSPRGVYQELRTTNNAFLATQGGAVGIGTTNPAGILEVSKGAPTIYVTDVGTS